VVSVAISPDGNLVAAAYDDFTIHVWDANTREEISNLYGHNDTITGLRFTSDNRLLVSTSLDGTIRLWGIPN
jgi:WD40 repeat protein